MTILSTGKIETHKVHRKLKKYLQYIQECAILPCVKRIWPYEPSRIGQKLVGEGTLENPIELGAEGVRRTTR